MLVMSNLQQHYMIRKLANKSLMPMIEAHGITADTMKNAVYKKALKKEKILMTKHSLYATINSKHYISVSGTT